MNTESVQDKIITARLKLLFKEPFFGNMATRLKIVEIPESDTWCSTAATDGKHFYYKHAFLENLTIDNIVFVLCHEVLHVVFDHISRFREYSHRSAIDIELIGAACDYVTNECLVKYNIGTPIPNFNMYHDKKYYDKTAEEVFLLLQDKFPKGKLLDDHINWCVDTGDNKPVLSDAEIQEIHTATIEAIIHSASIATQTAQGSVPLEIERLIKKLTNPVMNWRQLIRQQIHGLHRHNYSYNRPNRRLWHLECMFPSRQASEMIDICVALDTSGSITNAIATDFLSEIKGIMEEFDEFRIKLWSFDTKVYNVQDFDEYNIQDYYDYKLMGGGGTSLGCNWDYMKENDIVPKKFIVFTDMQIYDGVYGDPDYTDTLFIAYNTDKIAPHGITVKYER